jgi:hypothetical protein
MPALRVMAMKIQWVSRVAEEVANEDKHAIGGKRVGGGGCLQTI